jgi:hypothetical protein
VAQEFGNFKTLLQAATAAGLSACSRSCAPMAA